MQADELFVSAAYADEGINCRRFAGLAAAASPVVLPIPGTSSVKHLEENVSAAAFKLSDAEFASLAPSFPSPIGSAAEAVRNSGQLRVRPHPGLRC